MQNSIIYEKKLICAKSVKKVLTSKLKLTAVLEKTNLFLRVFNFFEIILQTHKDK